MSIDPPARRAGRGAADVAVSAADAEAAPRIAPCLSLCCAAVSICSAAGAAPKARMAAAGSVAWPKLAVFWWTLRSCRNVAPQRRCQTTWSLTRAQSTCRLAQFCLSITARALGVMCHAQQCTSGLCRRAAFALDLNTNGVSDAANAADWLLAVSCLTCPTVKLQQSLFAPANARLSVCPRVDDEILKDA